MTQAEMQRLEGAIGRTLPDPVRHFFLNFPTELRDREPDPEDDDFALTDDADALIEMNRPGLCGLQPLDWMPDVFILGAGGCGETFWIDLTSPQGSVHRFDAGEEAGASAELADSIVDFADQFLDTDAQD